MNAIVFSATVFKVQNITQDGGIRVTLDLSEDAIPEMAMLLETRRKMIPLKFTAVADEPFIRMENGDDRQSSKRKVRTRE